MVRVALTLTHGYITYLGQDVKLPTNYIDVAEGKEIKFTAAADTGYELDAVKMVAGGAQTELTADAQGTYTVPAASVAEGLGLVIEAKAVQAESDENPAAEPLTEDTVVEDEAPVVEEEAVVEADVSTPAFEGYAYVGGVTVKVTAAEGVLPEGTAVQASLVERNDVVGAVEAAVESQGKVLEDAVAIDVTLVDAEGNAIQPAEPVNVCFFGAAVSGEEVGVYRVADDASAVQPIGARQTDPSVQSFDVDHFSIYVVGATTGVGSDGKQTSSTNRYSMNVGDTKNVYTNDTRNTDGEWSSSNKEVATVEANGTTTVNKKNRPQGKITATGVGDAEITYSWDWGWISTGWVSGYYGYKSTDTFYITVSAPEVSFDANGGTGAPDAVEIKKDGEATTVTIPGDTPVRDGYTFLGWGVSADSADAKYEAGQTYTLSETEDLAGATLYAVWQEITATSIEVTAEGDTTLVKGDKLQLTAVTDPADAHVT